MAEKRKVEKTATFVVRGEDPRQAGAPIFSNFVGISHVGSEVQFEFIFLDINEVAVHIQRKEKAAQEGQPSIEEKPTTVQGKTVAKIVMPVSSFVQVKGHLQQLFEKFSGGDREKEEINERARSSG